MGILELFAAVLIVGVSCLNASLPAVAWRRAGDRRFLALTAGHALVAALGGVWVWGELPVSAPGWSVATGPILGLVLLATLLFLASTLWPRRTP